MTTSTFGTQKVAVVPFAVDADAQPQPPGGLPQGGVTRIALPNRHFEYALTWYGLAAALVAVYLAFFASRLRQPET
jgi:surfeit locus 1 family protein